MKSLELAVPPLVVVVITAMLMWLAAKLAPGLDYRFSSLQVLGVITAIGGVAVSASGVIQFRRMRTTVDPRDPGKASSLAVGGVYSVTRNPMYLGFAWVLLGWALFLGNVAVLAGPALFIAYIDRFQIHPEERALAGRFPLEFEKYRQVVRRWI